MLLILHRATQKCLPRGRFCLSCQIVLVVGQTVKLRQKVTTQQSCCRLSFFLSFFLTRDDEGGVVVGIVGGDADSLELLLLDVVAALKEESNGNRDEDALMFDANRSEEEEEEEELMAMKDEGEQLSFRGLPPFRITRGQESLQRQIEERERTKDRKVFAFRSEKRGKEGVGRDFGRQGAENWSFSGIEDK
jgi:hypothetical protein